MSSDLLPLHSETDISEAEPQSARLADQRAPRPGAPSRKSLPQRGRPSRFQHISFMTSYQFSKITSDFLQSQMIFTCHGRFVSIPGVGVGLVANAVGTAQQHLRADVGDGGTELFQPAEGILH